MKLYLIRHGQTEANFHKTHSGWGDVMLTVTGKEQARRIGRVLKKYPSIKYTQVTSHVREIRRSWPFQMPNTSFVP